MHRERDRDLIIALLHLIWSVASGVYVAFHGCAVVSMCPCHSDLYTDNKMFLFLYFTYLYNVIEAHREFGKYTRHL